MWLGIIFPTLLCLVRLSSQILTVEELSLDHLPLSEAALYVTRRYISRKTNTLVIMEKCMHCSQNFQYRLLDHYLLHFDSMMSISLFMGEKDDLPWDYNIFIVDSLIAFETLRFNLPQTLHEREFYFLVILSNSHLNKMYRQVAMQKILKSCQHFNVHNVVIMVLERDQSISFYTHELKGHGHYLHNDVRLINRYRNGKLEHDFLFPFTFNLNNCTLNVNAYPQPPLVMFDGDPSNVTQLAQLDRLGGIDGELLKRLGKELNFQISLTIPRDPISLDYSASLCFEGLENGSADLAIGGFSNTHNYRWLFTPSTTYHQSPFVFVVRSDRHFGPISQLLQPFDVGVWGAIGGTFACALFIIRSIQMRASQKLKILIMGPHNYNPVTNMLMMFLGFPIRRLPKRNFARFLVMCWMLATLVLRNAYQGKMFDSLRVSRRIPLPRGIDELLQRDYILLSTTHVDYYPHNRTFIVDGNFTERYDIVNTNKDIKFTTISMLDNLAHYNQWHWNSSSLTHVDEHIYTRQEVIFYRKHSMLKFVLDRKIKQMMSAGINSLLEKQFIKKAYATMNVGNQCVPEISNKMLGGLYCIYGVLMTWSMTVFLGELLSRRIAILKRFFTWIHCNQLIG